MRRCWNSVSFIPVFSTYSNMKCLHIVQITLIVKFTALGTLAQTVTYTTKPREELTCDFSSSISSGQWTEVFLNDTTELLFVLSSGTVLPQNSAKTKYKNFNATWNPMNEQFALVLTDVDKDDGGTYQCIRLTDDPVDFQLEVEVVNSVVITHSGTETVEVGKSYPFTCTAQGVRSSNQLQLVWSTDDATHDSETTRTVNSDDDSLEDLESRYTLMPKKTDTFIKCEITGYQTQEELKRTIITEIVQLEVQYAPNCTLLLEEVEVTDSCTVELTCTCDGKPEPMTEGYQYFRDNSLIDGRNTATETLDLPLDSETTIAFTCSGSNSVGEGEQSADEPYTCESPPTTTPPTTTVSTTVTTPLIDITSPISTTPVKTNKGLVIGFSCAGGIIALVLIGVLVYWFCLKKREDGKGNNTVKDSTVDSTNSAPPVYGVVDKSSKKKKSENTDGNGVNAKLAEEQPEYAAVNKPKSQPQAAPRPRSSQPPDNKEQMELQYADLDHGNRGRTNEIHQPADEPTQYAEVKSIIV